MPELDHLWQGNSKCLHFAGAMCKIVALSAATTVGQTAKKQWKEIRTVDPKVTTARHDKIRS